MTHLGHSVQEAEPQQITVRLVLGVSGLHSGAFSELLQSKPQCYESVQQHDSESKQNKAQSLFKQTGPGQANKLS